MAKTPCIYEDIQYVLNFFFLELPLLDIPVLITLQRMFNILVFFPLLFTILEMISMNNCVVGSFVQVCYFKMILNLKNVFPIMFIFIHFLIIMLCFWSTSSVESVIDVLEMRWSQNTVYKSMFYACFWLSKLLFMVTVMQKIYGAATCMTMNCISWITELVL